MEMERIDEDTIRVEIEHSDLEERGIKFLDLLGNRKQIENFFYSILEEVDIDEQFHESDAITFQVLPKGNGLELFISKDGPSTDQLDLSTAEGFSREDIADYIQNKITDGDQRDEMDEIDSYMNDITKRTKEFVFEFEDFEDLIGLSKMLYLENGVSNVYFYNEQYYLELVFFTEEMQVEKPERELAMALEYAKQTNVTSSILEEYGSMIMEKSALELTRHYFK
ncbi:adaptor protein MecA [Desemzia sp. RIT804]|uniref:adaptor protein MecA n=1 Tax=Desemzia sp. RIT 804 TaxID=2810209 RepID=UPI0019506A07|nr:adaptor protein MecA [Desemzia sp. RIT 804]MBM6613458.1 adaptor protein MecA [Desemzia sp. RIT 804]